MRAAAAGKLLGGFGDHWHNIAIPGLEYIVIENTLAKFGREVELLTKLPLNVQTLVGSAELAG